MPFTNRSSTADWLLWGIFYEKYRSIFFRILITSFVNKMYCRLSERCDCAPLIDVRHSTVITAQQGRAVKRGASNMAANTVRVNSLLPKTVLITVQGCWAYGEIMWCGNIAGNMQRIAV